MRGVIRALAAVRRRLALPPRREAAPLALLLLALSSVFVFGGDRGYLYRQWAHDNLTVQTMTVARNLSPDDGFQMCRHRTLRDGEPVCAYPYNAYPIGSYALVRLAAEAAGDGLARQLYAARLLTLAFFAGAAVLAWLALARLLGDRWIAAAATLLAWSSYYLLYYADQVGFQGHVPVRGDAGVPRHGALRAGGALPPAGAQNRRRAAARLARRGADRAVRAARPRVRGAAGAGGGGLAAGGAGRARAQPLPRVRRPRRAVVRAAGGLGRRQRVRRERRRDAAGRTAGLRLAGAAQRVRRRRLAGIPAAAVRRDRRVGDPLRVRGLAGPRPGAAETRLLAAEPVVRRPRRRRPRRLRRGAARPAPPHAVRVAAAGRLGLGHSVPRLGRPARAGCDVLRGRRPGLLLARPAGPAPHPRTAARGARAARRRPRRRRAVRALRRVDGPRQRRPRRPARARDRRGRRGDPRGRRGTQHPRLARSASTSTAVR